MAEHKEQEGTPRLDEALRYTIYSYKFYEPVFAEILPEDTRGLRFLEIGAGQNNTPAVLREKGIDAFAIDPGYRLPQQLDQLIDRDLLDVPAEYRNYWNEIRRRFREDREANPDRYLPAVAQYLPFRPESFDIILSSHCICPILSHQEGELIKALKEIQRVLAPGGTILIYPYDIQEDIFDNLSDADIEKHGRNLETGLDLFRGNSFRIGEVEFDFDRKDVLTTRLMLLIQKRPEVF